MLLPLFSLTVVSDSLRPHGLQHARLHCPLPSPRVCSNARPLSCWCPPAISLSVTPFSSRLQSYPASGYFSMSRLFTSGSQSVEASESVLPMNIQSRCPLGLIGLIFLLSKGCQESSPAPQFEGVNSSVLSLFYCPALTSIHDYRRNHSFDDTDLYRKSNASAF